MTSQAFQERYFQLQRKNAYRLLEVRLGQRISRTIFSLMTGNADESRTSLKNLSRGLLQPPEFPGTNAQSKAMRKTALPVRKKGESTLEEEEEEEEEDVTRINDERGL